MFVVNACNYYVAKIFDEEVESRSENLWRENGPNAQRRGKGVGASASGVGQDGASIPLLRFQQLLL